MILKPYKQTTCEGCLPVCLLLLGGQKTNLDSELSLLMGGYKRARESYALGISWEFVSKYKRNIKIFVDNLKYSKTLSKLNKSSGLELVYSSINLRFLKSVQAPFILNLDNHLLREYVHYPHFVIVEKRKDKNFSIIDPWEGKRRRLDIKKIEKGVVSLRNHLKFCPLIIQVKGY